MVCHEVVPHAFRQAGNLTHADGLVSQWQEQSVWHPAVASSKECKNRAGPTTKHAEGQHIVRRVAGNLWNGQPRSGNGAGGTLIQGHQWASLQRVQ
jgi:hypothetical protein